MEELASTRNLVFSIILTISSAMAWGLWAAIEPTIEADKVVGWFACSFFGLTALLLSGFLFRRFCRR